jgi:glucosamine 6-phosphate synthetase-like amidotransferase/phosphosugar isomerase protein
MTKVVEFNCETNTEIIRDMTEDELDAQKRVEENKLILAAEAEAKKLARQSVYDKLGLTADDVAALFD